jgi:cell division protein FtsI (penicillin-binding protein 3)
VFVLSLLAGRLLQLQGLDAPAYAATAERSRLQTHVLSATRGSILDTNGVELASTVDAKLVFADQTLVEDPAAMAHVLAPVLQVDEAELAAKLTGTRHYKVLVKQVTPETWRRITELRLPDGKPLVAIGSEPASRRVYAAGAVAANLLGFVNGEGKPGGGLEYELDSLLSGTNGSATYEQASGGRQIPLGESVVKAAVPGKDVRLTINRDIQWTAQNAAAKAMRDTGAQSATVNVLDVRTGEVLAMATTPSFDPNSYSASPPGNLGNRALTESYEPGSTGKVMTAAALIEAGAITPETPITVPNRLKRADKSFKDFEPHGTLHLTYAGTLAKSSNIGTILAAERLGMTKLPATFAKFGIGQPTGLGFPGESKGRLPQPGTAAWSATTGYTLSFGQGYSVNTLQMASVFATIANSGVRVQPSLVKGWSGPDGTFHPADPAPRTRVVSPATAATVSRMMEAVTMPGGTAPKAAIPGYRVAGKTGTAQRVDPKCGCYRGYTMSFIGFAPADKPRLVVAVTLQAPKRGIGGGATAGPVFKQVMTFALQTLRVAPTGTRPPAVRLTTG